MAGESWREAMATRSMGSATPSRYRDRHRRSSGRICFRLLRSAVDTARPRGMFVVVAMIALTIAWVVGWVVVEAAILDWRLAARRAAACELLANATLEVTSEPASIS